MYDMLILCEKPSAKAHFSKVMGGVSGTFNGQTYLLTNALGHLLKFKDPDEQVTADLQERYADWHNLDNFPWDLNHFDWSREVIPPAKNSKFSTTPADVLAKIANDSKQCKAIVIATDNDPTGEGDLLAWEIINAIDWDGKVYRIKFTDGFTKATLSDIFTKKIDVSDQSKHGAYLKGEARSRFDFASIQLTRIATFLVRDMGYNVTAIRIGRLKSVIIKVVYDQLKAYNDYVKMPYYELRFIDENKHVYSKKDAKHFKHKRDVDLNTFSKSPVDKPVIKRSYLAPPALINLSSLGSKLAEKGYSAKEVKQTYQNLYQAGYLSYPRTADKGITQAQFNELLLKIDALADLIGVDKTLLTHRQLRKKHLDNSAEHGANRPTTTIPANLKVLQQYGKSAVDVYKTVVKSFLAIICEDYEYDSVTAKLVKYPDYETKFQRPIKANWKTLLSTDKADDVVESKLDCGKVAEPFVHQGVNKRPPRPTQNSVFKFLEKYNVGTGATRLDAMVTLTAPHHELADNKGYLKLTDIGELNALMLKNTYIADAKVTERLYMAMERVEKFEVSINQLLKTLTTLVIHDKKQMQHNAKYLNEGKDKPIMTQVDNKFTKKAKMTAEFNGEQVTFNTSFADHTFTDDEIEQLLAGESITISFTTKAGKPCKVKGHFGRGEFHKGDKVYKYWGFIKDEFIND